MNNFDIIIIGGGAAGLMAGGHAAGLGAKTLILEKMPRTGRKLYITGKGRCNITNIDILSEYNKHIGTKARFLKPAFHNFFNSDLIDFFNKIGVPTIIERGGRVFPASQKAVDVVDALVKWCKKNKTVIKSNTQVKKLILENYRVTGVEDADGNKYFSKAVIIATGGASYPATGSTGDGYGFAKSAGHNIIPVKPVLVPFETSGNIAKQLQGLSLRNVTAQIWVDNKKYDEEFGEMLFTHFGVSGPIILSLSRRLNFDENKKYILSIDLKPALDEKKLDARLIRDLNNFGKMKFSNILREWLPKKMIPVFLDILKISSDKLCNQINSKERKSIRILLKNLKLEITGVRSFKEAIITNGGVDTIEVDKKTMSSKICKSLYFAGEVLDVDADTGGYNLQIAFSTARLAAENAVKNI